MAARRHDKPYQTPDLAHPLSKREHLRQEELQLLTATEVSVRLRAVVRNFCCSLISHPCRRRIRMYEADKSLVPSVRCDQGGHLHRFQLFLQPQQQPKAGLMKKNTIKTCLLKSFTVETEDLFISPMPVTRKQRDSLYIVQC